MKEVNLEEVKSLVGKIDTKGMGSNVARDKPKRPTKPKKREEEWQLKGGNILEENFDESLSYRPRTKENKLIYENYLGRVQELVQDQPPSLLLAIADEVLAIVRGDFPEEKKRADTEALIGGKIKEDTFIDLCNTAKNLSDYNMDTEVQGDNIVAVDEELDEDEEEQMQEIAEEEEEKQGEVQVKQEAMDAEEDLDANKIGANWLSDQLGAYYSREESNRMEKEIMSVLNGPSAMEVENTLLSIFNYDRLDMVALLLRNRKTIFYCIRYHQTTNEKERDLLGEEMRQEGVIIGQKRQEHQERVVEEVVTRAVREDEISRISKKILDLTIHDSEDRTGASKQEYRFKLPEGATRSEKTGYEEIYIPAQELRVEEKLIEVTELPSWMQPVFSEIKRFNPIQSRVLPHTLETDLNMLVCAPTSAGKTNVALLSVLQTIGAYRDSNSGEIDLSKFKIVYIAPMKALVSEVTGNLSNRLKSLGLTVRELTGDVHLSRSQIEETQVIVSTPEKWDIITRKTGERLFVEQVRLIIIDEIHLLSDSRGPVLESIIARTIRQNENGLQQTRLVGLSATLPNYRDVAAALRIRKEGLFYFDQSYRPIPLEQRYIGVTEKKGVRKMLMLNEILYEKVMERVGSYQMIVFVHSRRDTVRTANAIKDTAYARNESNLLMRPESESKKIIEAIVEKETINSKELKELLVNGIGVHHAGLSRGDRDLVEQLFADRHFNVLVSTATLAWGVNLPAHTVIIKGTQVYSPELGRWIELSLQDVMQMLGRAGRPRFDREGEGIILTGYEEVRYYLSLLNLQIPLESQMLSALADQLNAEVVQGSVNSLKDGVNWLSYTYLYVRMLRNPRYYSIPADEIEEDKELLRRRVNLVHTAFTILERNGLLSYDRRSGNVSSTFLGKTASYYYIKHSSMAIYNSNLKANCGIIELLRVFAMSIEFKYLAVREEEKNELKKLIETVPIPIKGAVEEITTKIAALLEAHISRLHLEGLALNVDKVYVTQSAGRIVRALFEICLKRGWGQVAQRALELAKMVDRTMWTCLNPLRQFKSIPEYVLGRLEKKEQFSWESFYQMTPQEIGDLTKFPKLGKILHKFVHHVPRVQLEAYAQPLTRSCLRVELTARSDFRWEDEYHGREEPFWLFVLDCNEESILYSYYFTLSKTADTFSTEFILPLFEVMHPLYYIKVISDRWVCPDNVLPLSFRSMVLPSKFSPPHELADLQPLSASVIDPIAREMRIGYLNQVQTQAYPAFMNSTQNLLLAAAEGSGKFTLAVFSINQTLQNYKKVVVVVSHTSIAIKRSQHLTKIFPKKKVARTFEDLAKDTQVLASADVIVTTPSAWDVLTRRWKSRKGFSDIGLVVVDNLHLLSEGNATLEIVVSRMRIIASESPNAFRMICLSAPLADYTEVAEWIGASPETTLNFHASVRPNSVEVIFHSSDQSIRESRLHMMQKQLITSVLHYNRSTLVIVSNRRQARVTAIDLVSELSSESNPKRLKKISEKQLEAFGKRIGDQYLMHVIEYGIGYIYEGMPELERQIIEELYKVEGITILISTHELKWEFDYKSFAVAVLDCCHYDPKQQRWVDYTIPEMMQLMSLACASETDKHKGREYQSGKFLVYCEAAKKNFYKKFLFEPYPLESSLQMHLRDHLCASVVARSVAGKGDAVDWLTWTFMYRRLPCNPNYYNMEEVSEQSLSMYLSDLVDETVDYLTSVKCLESEEGEEEGALSATNLAIICSYYYIKVDTLATFLSKTNEQIKLRDVIATISQAEELEHCQYRPKEYETIAQLLTSASEKPLNKAHGLLMLYLHRIPMTAELLQECKSILPLCVRLTHSLVDVVSSLGYLRPLIFCMQFCQMLVQAMWIHESPLLQILDRNIVETLVEQYNVKEIGEFVDMEDEERRKVLKGKDIDRIASACNRYPSLSLHAEVNEKTEEEVKLQVSLERDEELESEAVISGYYPIDKEEYWWVVVGDKKNNRVLATKRTLLAQKVQLDLDFEVGEVSSVVVYALCDSYVGCDQAEELTL